MFRGRGEGVKTFDIPCKWTFRTVEKIQARTLEEAMRKADALSEPETLTGAKFEPDDLFHVDYDGLEKIYPTPKEKDPMEGWEKVRDDAYNKCYRRKFGDSIVTVSAHAEEEVGWGGFDYGWTIESEGDDFSVSSKKTYNSPEDAAKDAEDRLRKAGGYE